MSTNIEYPVSNYTMEVSRSSSAGFLAKYKELGHSVLGYGQTPAEAIADLQEAILELSKVYGESNKYLPEPREEPSWTSSTGKVTVRLTKLLHYNLIEIADQEEVSLNLLINSILQSAVTAMSAGLQFGAIPKLDMQSLAIRGIAAALQNNAEQEVISNERWQYTPKVRNAKYSEGEPFLKVVESIA